MVGRRVQPWLLCLLGCQQKHSAVLQICASLLRLYCTSLVRNADSCAFVFFFFSPTSTRTHQHTLVCVCTHRSARVSVRLWLQRTGFPSHVDHSDGLLLGFVYPPGLHVGSGPLIRARFDPGLVQPEAWRSWTEQSERLCSCSEPLERQRWFSSVQRTHGGLDPERNGAAEVLSFSATGDSCAALQAGSSFYRNPKNRRGFGGKWTFLGRRALTAGV